MPYLDIANLLKYNYSFVIIMYALYKNKSKVKIKDYAFKLVSKLYIHTFTTQSLRLDTYRILEFRNYVIVELR